jgi:AbrB family looped-hinge helix DNA binding protein
MVCISHTIAIDQDGRILIPSELRRKLNLSKGDTIVLIEHGDRLTLVKKGNRNMEAEEYQQLKRLDQEVLSVGDLSEQELQVISATEMSASLEALDQELSSTEGKHMAIINKSERLKKAQNHFAALFKDKPHVGVEDFLEFRRMDAQLERDV